MRLKTITPPASEPVDISDAMRQLAIDDCDIDARETLSALIKQAREYCELYQNRKYITQTLEATLDSSGGVVEFTNCSPVQEVESVKYLTESGTEVTVPPSQYRLDDSGLVHRLFFSSPIQSIPGGIKIRFVAGYGGCDDVPHTVKQAMILQTKLLYDDYDPERRRRLEMARDRLLSLERVVPA